MAAKPTICSYCSSSYEDPRILSCLHSYCLRCISKIHEECTTASITCPSCNYSTPLPIDEGVASLPVNIHLKEKIEQDQLLQRVISSPPPRCDSCKDNSPSLAYCRDCNDMLCSDCWKMHQKMKVLKSHSTFALNDLKKNQTMTEVRKMVAPSTRSPLCPEHDDHQKLCFYCTQCNVPVCVGCTVDRHSKDNGHTVQEVDGYASRTKTAILQDIKELPEEKKQLEQLLKNIDEMKEQVQERKHEIDFTICETFAKLPKLIDQREKALLAENNEVAVSKITRLSMQQEKVQHLLESIIQCHSLSSIATSEYSYIQLLSIARTLHNRAVSLHQEFNSTPIDACVTPHLSVDFNTSALVDMIGEFGGLADPSTSSIAVVPRQRLGKGAEMKVTVVVKDSRGKEINEGGARVMGRLSGNGGIGSLATDNGDGTYLVSVIPQQLGQHQLSITVNDQFIQDSPFTLNIVPQCGYSKCKQPVQTVSCTSSPNYIAFSDSCDMFVSSSCDCCIYVYDESGNKKTTIGSGKLQFSKLYGIDVVGEVVYVAEYGKSRIHKVTTEGEFIGTFGENGSDIGQFKCPFDVKISPDGKVYVADRGNDRVQVFNPDWTISHVINGNVSGDNASFTDPTAIAFDLSGDVHVASYNSSSVTVFTPSGQFVRRYADNHAHFGKPGGITIDPSGYSLVVSYSKGTLLIFDPDGTLIHSVNGFKCPYGVSISPNGSIWMADAGNNKLVKY